MTAITALPTTDVLTRMSLLSREMQSWGASTHATGGFPHREMAALREHGFFTITTPGEVLAGGEQHTARLLQLLKLVGFGNLSVGRIYEGHVNALELIRLYATPAQQRRWFEEADAGHLFGVWNTEMRDGLELFDQGGAAAGAEREGGADAPRCKVSGSKSFCSGSTFVTRPIITGKRFDRNGEESGWQMLIPHLDELDPPVETRMRPPTVSAPRSTLFRMW